MTAHFQPDPYPGCTIRGGVTPSFWMGARRPHAAIPTMSGLELADRIRRVLQIPRSQVLQDHALSGVSADAHAIGCRVDDTKPRKMARRKRKSDHESKSTA